MLKDITIGQFFQGESLIHKLDPRTKIKLTMFYVIAIFIMSGISSYILATIYLLAFIYNSKIPFKLVAKAIKPLIFLIVFTSIINIFYTTGEPIFEIGFLTVTYEGLILSFFMIWRIILLVAGTSMLTYTTSPIFLTDGIERLMSPLKKIKFPVHEFSMMMTIALRFIPTLIDETEKIISAQKARGADFESGNLMTRAKSLVPILIPLFVSSFRRADELAVAMECRLYHGGEGRTRLRVLKYQKTDHIIFVTAILYFVVMVAI